MYLMMQIVQQSLLVLLRSESGVRVGDLHRQLLSALHDLFSLLAGNGVCDLGGECSVLHHEDLKILETKRWKQIY